MPQERHKMKISLAGELQFIKLRHFMTSFKRLLFWVL
jgi:hypothetical protein